MRNLLHYTGEGEAGLSAGLFLTLGVSVTASGAANIDVSQTAGTVLMKRIIQRNRTSTVVYVR